MRAVASTVRAMRDAYSSTGSRWGDGPVQLYGRLAVAMVDRSPMSLAGRTVLDVGAGSGVVSGVLADRGARAVQVDFALGMLLANRSLGLPATVGDVTRLPVRDSSVGGAAAGFCLNHLAAPAVGLRELARVVEPGGVVLTSTFGRQDPHPAKAIVDDVAARYGYAAPAWYRAMKETVEPLLGTVDAMRSVAGDAALTDADITETTVDAGIDTPEAMAAYRLGMAHLSPFVADLAPGEQQALRAETLAALDGLPPVRPNVIVLAATIS